MLYLGRFPLWLAACDVNQIKSCRLVALVLKGGQRHANIPDFTNLMPSGVTAACVF